MVFSINKSKILSKERVSKVTLSVPPSTPGGFRATPGEGTATFNWAPPLKRIDGSELTDLKGYNIYRSKEQGINVEVTTKWKRTIHPLTTLFTQRTHSRHPGMRDHLQMRYQLHPRR
jgi:hypothetical protein